MKPELKYEQHVADLGTFATFARVPVFDGVTDLEHLNNLSDTCKPAHIYVKRDDCNNLAFGGNKVRQVEYYFGDALEQGADTVLITGATQSNFVRITAAMAAKLSLGCHIQLESRVANNQSDYYRDSGNVLLDRLFGAKLYYYDKGEDEHGADARLRNIAADLKAAGRKPYVIPLAPGHKPLGALGYVRAALELKEQLQRQNLQIDEIIVASGSGNTHAGLLFGLRALNVSIPVTGVCVRRSGDLQWDRIKNRCQEIADLLEVESKVTDADINLTDEYLAPGYGQASAKVWDSLILAAQKEALVLDPTYTGKTFAAVMAKARQVAASQNLLFMHTGGSPGIFGYQDQIQSELATRC